MYSEDQYIMISAIQHYVFCPRQCGLIHVAKLWHENALTAKGRIMHDRVHSSEDEHRNELHTVRGIALRSDRLGITGKTDLVEFTTLPDGTTLPYPVEYKAGKPKMDISDLGQLCAQAICIEEMTGFKVETAALYYGKPRRRVEVAIDALLRVKTEAVIADIHRMVETGVIPKAKYMKRCASCSLVEECMPRAGDRKTENYIRGLYSQDEETCEYTLHNES